MWKTEYTVEKILRLSPISCMYISHIQHTYKHTFIQVCMCICTCIHMASWHCNNFASFYLFSDRIKFSERAGWGRCCAWRGSWSEHFWHFLRGRNIAKSAVWVVVFFIYPGRTKKTKINAHELEALRFLLRFLWPLRTHREHTHRQGRAEGCGWLRACTHAPCEHQLLAVRRADERSGSGQVDFWEQTRIQKFATCYRQVRLVCVCARDQICMCHHQICMRIIRYACDIIRYACAIISHIYVQ